MEIKIIKLFCLQIQKIHPVYIEGKKHRSEEDEKMAILKDTVLFIIVPLVAFLYKILWNKCQQLEALYTNCKGYTICSNVFALKGEFATKQDISDMLDVKFAEFELKLIKEGRLEAQSRRNYEL